MSTPQHPVKPEAEAHFACAVAQRLSHGHAMVHPDIAARLRIARQQAVSMRKPEPLPAMAWVSPATAGIAPPQPWWIWGARAFPLLALVAGLALITQWQADDRAEAIAEIDAALLTDELPTEAYLDPGFRQYLLRESNTH